MKYIATVINSEDFRSQFIYIDEENNIHVKAEKLDCENYFDENIVNMLNDTVDRRHFSEVVTDTLPEEKRVLLSEKIKTFKGPEIEIFKDDTMEIFADKVVEALNEYAEDNFEGVYEVHITPIIFNTESFIKNSSSTVNILIRGEKLQNKQIIDN